MSSLLMASTVLGCSPSPATQLIVVVDTDLAIPTALDGVEVAVTRPDGTVARQRQALSSRALLPLTLTVLAEHDALGPVAIEASGVHGTATVVTRQAQVMLVRGQTRVVTMHLTASCVGVVCARASDTCTESGCASRVVTDPPPWTGTPPRLGADAGPMPADGGPVDGGGPRDAGGDAGCVRDADCDDGLFCDGIEHCVAGGCTRPGDPCSGNTTCDEAADRCRGCTTRGDCPLDDTGTFGPCDYADACDVDAMRERTDTTYDCVAEACVPTPRTVSEACTRDTDGTACGDTTCGSFGACTATDVCAQGGMATRTCTDFTCGGGTCGSAPRHEAMMCTRTTDGTACGMMGCAAWGTCSYAASCDETGVRHRTCTSPTCAGGACAPNATTEDDTAGCPRDTDGIGCGAGMACVAGACRSCVPALTGSVGTTYPQKTVTGSGSTLSFVDTNSGAASLMAPAGVTFSGSFTATTVAFSQIHASGNTIRFVDWGGAMGTITVSGASVSGDFVAPCIPFMTGCIPGSITQLTASGSVVTLRSNSGATGTLTFDCP